MADLSVDEFMAQLEELDVTIAEKVQNAQAKGCELRCDMPLQHMFRFQVHHYRGWV